MTSNITSVCIAIIGKDVGFYPKIPEIFFRISNENLSLIPQNSPLYIATSDLDRELELHYSVHASLDIIEEKCLPASGKQTVDSRDLYLGMLYSTETDKMYNFQGVF